MSTRAQGKAGNFTTRCGVACGQYLWQYLEVRGTDQSAEEVKAHYAVLKAVLYGHGSESAIVHGLQTSLHDWRWRALRSFTITDAYSRYLVRCQIVSRMDLSQVRTICEAAMREYGRPQGSGLTTAHALQAQCY